MAKQLQRELNNRHIQLIAIGGAIGTGLFLGSGQTISLTGPSLLFTYMLIGIVLFAFMRALGELLLSNSKFNSFVDIANEYLGPFGGFVVGGPIGFVGLSLACRTSLRWDNILLIGIHKSHTG